MEHHRLGQLLPDRQCWRERLRRGLRHVDDLAAPQAPKLEKRQLEKVDLPQSRSAVQDFHAAGSVADRSESCGALPAPGFASDTQDLAPTQCQAHAFDDRVDRPIPMSVAH